MGSYFYGNSASAHGGSILETIFSDSTFEDRSLPITTTSLNIIDLHGGLLFLHDVYIKSSQNQNVIVDATIKQLLAGMVQLSVSVSVLGKY